MTTSTIDKQALDGLTESDRLRQIVSEYCRNVDDYKYAELADLFHEDAVLDLGGLKTTGRDAIFAFFSSTRVLNIYGLHSTVNLIVNRTSVAASVSADFFWTNLKGPVPQIESVGRYFFELTKKSDQWRISSLLSVFRNETSTMTGGAADLWASKSEAS